VTKKIAAAIATAMLDDLLLIDLRAVIIAHNIPTVYIEGKRNVLERCDKYDRV